MTDVQDAPLLLAVGNHLRGFTRHFELAELGALFVRPAWTAASYRLLARGSEHPFKPGLVEVTREDGASIEGELYHLSSAMLNELAALVRPPIRLGLVTLGDGRVVHGYLCDPAEVAHASDISHLGGWRAFLETSAAE